MQSRMVKHIQDPEWLAMVFRLMTGGVSVPPMKAEGEELV